MTASALTAALGWLEVAGAALERAEECAAKGLIERDERYERARDALIARYREDKVWMRTQSAFMATIRGEKAA